MVNKELSRKDVDTIKAYAREKLVAYCKLNDVIGPQIFNILEKECKVLYYPLEEQQVWGFSEKIKGKSFVCINTSLPYDKQVFAAAHELYHLWYGTSGEVLISEDSEEPSSYREVEMWANRFAAEFLVNGELLRQEIINYDIDLNGIGIKDIIKLANLFVVPYKTMVRRLYELNIINKRQYTAFMEYTEEQVNIWRNRLAVSLPERKNKIGLADMIDRALNLYENKLITYEKLEYLLEFSGVSPKEVGVEKESTYEPPTDDELDAIMEE